MRIHIPAGFLFSAAAAGIKASGGCDLGYAEAPAGAAAAAVFTRNRVVAAPVEVGRDHLHRSGGRVRALIVNSGNANCATGAAGRRAAEGACRELAKRLKVPAREVLPSSTGIIGVPFPAEKLVAALPRLLADKGDDEAAVRRFAGAIMTTDTRPKIASLALAEVSAGRPAGACVLGIAKGSGMIAPHLATMLAYVFTDVAATPRELQRLLPAACAATFNCISVDHDTSTNDTVLLLASGRSGVPLRAVRKSLAAALTFVCGSLAEQIVSDGEGVKHVARLHIEGARSRREALCVARSIAGSLLVKTALAGADPNWGRILAAAGYSGVNLDPRRINIFIGPQQVCRQGEARPFDPAAAHACLLQPSYDLRVQLGRGQAAVEFLTTDLTEQYVRINAEYST
jgi:glutamate N-acetyltransferase/amino-acid N-acetyltransferase